MRGRVSAHDWSGNRGMQDLPRAENWNALSMHYEPSRIGTNLESILALHFGIQGSTLFDSQCPFSLFGGGLP